jgi:protoporphyrinogen oxidase
VKWAILGGGLTGVTLARLLKEKGHEVTVLEKEPKIGGLCKSETRNGFTFDCGGSHIIFSRDGEVLSFMQNVLEENREFRTRNTKIFYKGQYIKYRSRTDSRLFQRKTCFSASMNTSKT